MLLIFGLFSAALAADGFYDTTSIAGESEVFTNANAMQTTYAEVSGRSGAIASALNEYQSALDLLGTAAPEGQQAYVDELTAQFTREQSQLQDFVGTLIDNFDGAFISAMERAIANHDGTAVECEARISSGRQLPGMPSRTQENPDCVGENLNPTLAAAMDADPELQPTVDALMAQEWPTLTIPETPAGSDLRRGGHWCRALCQARAPRRTSTHRPRRRRGASPYRSGPRRRRRRRGGRAPPGARRAH